MNIRRAALATSAVFAICLAAAGAASAHTLLVGSDPADGERLASAPGVVRLRFDQAVSRELSRVELRGARSGRVDGVAVVAAPGSALVISVPKLGRDSYLLTWQAVSADDLHPSSGTVTFGIGGAAVPRTSSRPATEVDGPSAVEVAFRWVDFGALAGLIGALALALVCAPRARSRGAVRLDAAERRLLGVAVLSGTAALWTGLGLLVVQAHGIADGRDTDLGAVLAETHYGRAWLVRELLVAALIAGALLTALRGRRRWVTCVMLATAPLLALSLAAASHSASTRGVASVATAALALHVLAAALWAGGVCALTVVLVAGRRSARVDRRSAELLLRSFGGLAVASVAALAITGVYTAGVDVASTDDLVTTLYGRTLLVKTGLFAALGLVGLSNALLVHTGRGERRWLPRGLRTEAVLLTVILLPAAVLLATAPPRAPRSGPDRVVEAASRPTYRSLDAGDLIVSLAVKPNVPGTNFVSAQVVNTRRPAPGPVRSVDISVARTGARVAWRRSTRLGSSTWQLSDARFPRGGRWAVSLRIRRESLPEQVVHATWSVPRAPPSGPVALSVPGRPLAPLANILAVLIAAGLALVALAGLAKRLRAPAGPRLPAATEDAGRVNAA